MLTVACINHRNYLGRGAEYVAKLERGVKRHLTVPHQFVCLTERELGTELAGWWTKMELFRPGRFTGPVLYLDLDVVITANIDRLVTLAQSDPLKLWMRDDFSYSRVNPKPGINRSDLGGPGCCNSSVMLWHGYAMRPLWEEWQRRKTEIMATLHGDQNAITQILWPHWIGLLPNEMVQSYKYGIRMHGQKPAPIVVTHGSPKPHEIREDWIRCWQ